MADLLERAQELATVGQLLAGAAAGEGGALLIVGEAGIGKTSLVAEAIAAARDQGLRTFVARGGELEREFAFGVARQLFERHVRDGATSALEGAAAMAGPALGLAELPAPDTLHDAGLAAQHGLYWLACNLAEREPVLLAIDDAQWADVATLRWLVYLARRLEGISLAVVVAARSGEAGAHERLLDALAGEPATATLRPEPLGTDAVAELVRERLGGEPEPEFTAACREASAGNPFVLSELLTSAAAEQLSPTASAAAHVRGLTPPAVSRGIARRLGRCSPAAVSLAHAIAVLDVDASLRHVAGVAGLSTADAEAALDELEGARLVQTSLDGAYGTPQFRHPLMRTAAYDTMTAGERARAHRTSARLLDPDEPDRAAAHLLALPPAGDPWVAERLLAAGTRARARGAADAALALLERAAAEPAAPADRPALALELARAERLTISPTIVDALRAAFAAATGPDDREAAARELAHSFALFGLTEEAERAVETAIADLDPADRERALRLEADLVGLSLFAGTPSDRLDDWLARARDDLPGATSGERVLLATLGLCLIQRAAATGAEAIELTLRAVAGGRLVTDQLPDGLPLIYALTTLIRCDLLAPVDELIAEGIEDAHRRGSAAGDAIMVALRARRHFFAGDLAEAIADAETALGAAVDWGMPPSLVYVLAYQVLALLERGEPEAAEAALARYGLADAALPPILPSLPLLQARGELRLRTGRAAEALADAETMLSRYEPLSMPVPALGYRALGARAAWALGDEERAIALAREEVAEAERFGIAGDHGVALRVLGALTGDTALLEQACEQLARSPRRLELAHAEAELGAALRRANRRSEARAPLRRALELAYRCGAVPLVEHVREELRACGARPRRLVQSGADSLTPSERRVARLAAEGMTNREIAQRLYITRATVEAHLRAAYRKLGIATRMELDAAL